MIVKEQIIKHKNLNNFTSIFFLNIDIEIIKTYSHLFKFAPFITRIIEVKEFNKKGVDFVLQVLHTRLKAYAFNIDFKII